MAHNALIRGGTGSGEWDDYVVLGTDFEQIDQLLFEAINGDQGGTWAPATQIVIGGAGLDVEGDFDVDIGDITFGSTGTFTCNRLAGFNGVFSTGNEVSFGGTDRHVFVAETTMLWIQDGGYFAAKDGSTIEFDYGSTIIFDDIPIINRGVTIQGPLLMTAAYNGQIIDRYDISSDANRNLDGTDPQHTYIDDLSDDRTYLLSSANTLDGQTHEFSVYPGGVGGYHVDVNTDGAIPLLGGAEGHPLGLGAGETQYAKFKFMDSAWRLVFRLPAPQD